MRFKLINILFFLFLVNNSSFATHNRAGEITFEHVSELTYRITIKTFTYELSPADRPELEVSWGDNSTSIVRRKPYNRSGTIKLPGYYQLNIYDTTHTFPGPGNYEVIVQDPNRNFGVINIPNSVNVVFSISTVIMIAPELEDNDTPRLLSMPIDKAAKGHVFVHNPVAYDINGDSISYALSVCEGENGEPLETYTLPESSNRPVYIDPSQGNLIWDSPIDTGIYNVAIDIIEWRDGVIIGRILRDMQIEVYNTENNPPVNQNMNDYCVIAGDSIVFDVFSSDVDLDRIKQDFIGGPFEMSNPPTVTQIDDDYGLARSRFVWKTNCQNVRRLPYNLILKSTDINDDISLVDMDNFQVRVIGPAPENLTAEPSNTEIELNWTPQPCNNIVGYQIFRRVGQSGYTPDSCETGVTPESGFELIAQVNGSNTTIYIDNDNGQGLAQGIEYCYVVAAEYTDGALSIVSNEACAILLPGSPPLINTSVTEIDETNGSVFLAWIKPRHLDTIPANGPYEIIISRSDDLAGNELEVIHTFQTDSLNDTTYIDSGINTVSFPYSYSVELYNNEPGNRFLVGNPEIASTLYSDVVAGDNRLRLNFVKDVPWLNEVYVVFKKNSSDGVNEYDSIGFTEEGYYIDENLNNGTEYCYRVKSIGWRMIDSLVFENENWSHINCGVPIDTFPPCPPVLNVNTICDSLTNRVVWNNPNHSCANDVVSYRLLFSETIDGELEELAVINDPEDTVYFHFPLNGPAGCYAISAIDSFDNESILSSKVCVDECFGYDLPNVFTPNNDGNNDIFYSFNPNNYVKRVNMKIFNRWGMLVFETNDPDIKWDGRILQNNKIASTGVYYYTCEVFENRLVGTVTRNLVGFIHVYSGKTNSTVPID